eukprot:353638-Chlamydomonas_euryale.AAC.4
MAHILPPVGRPNCGEAWDGTAKPAVRVQLDTFRPITCSWHVQNRQLVLAQRAQERRDVRPRRAHMAAPAAGVCSELHLFVTVELFGVAETFVLPVHPGSKLVVSKSHRPIGDTSDTPPEFHD